ncbi:MAG: AraC family transcriptional regulator [Hungatella sp.]|nr:AraC family transcriptional regulator [Hungatella sp.]
MEQVVFQGGMEGLTVDQVIRDYEYSMAARHFHDTFELYYLLEGQRYYFIDKQTYLVKAGDVVLIKPNQIHKTSMAGISYHNRILFQISSQMMDPFLKACGMGTMEDVYGENAIIISIPENGQNEISELMFQIEKELKDRPRQYPVGVKLKLAQLLLCLTRHQKKAFFQQEPEKALTWKHQKVHEVADYLLNHPESQESLEELARRFYISKSYLSRIFREVTGFTVNEYKNVNRIKKSQQLLLHSGYSITEISGLLGFENLTYFERVFKKYVDTTPLKYRKTAVRQAL